MSVLSWRLFLYFFYHWPSFDFFYLSLTIIWMVFVFFNSCTIGRHSIVICFLYFFYHWPSFDWCSFSLFFFYHWPSFTWCFLSSKNFFCQRQKHFAKTFKIYQLPSCYIEVETTKLFMQRRGNIHIILMWVLLEFENVVSPDICLWLYGLWYANKDSDCY